MGADFEYETPYIVVYISYFVNVVVEVGGGDGYLHNGWDGKGDDNRLDVLPLYLPRDVGAVALSLLPPQQYRAVLNQPGLFLPLFLLFWGF